MTRQRTDLSTGTPFGLWVRNQCELDSRKYALDIQDVDYVVHRYQYAGFPKWRFLMLIEEKRYQSQPSFAQRDTQSILDQALTHANGMTVVTERGYKARLCYCGYHLLQFENNSPSDGALWWDGRLIDRATLIELLRFEINPKTLKRVS